MNNYLFINENTIIDKIFNELDDFSWNNERYHLDAFNSAVEFNQTNIKNSNDNNLITNSNNDQFNQESHSNKKRKTSNHVTFNSTVIHTIDSNKNHLLPSNSLQASPVPSPPLKYDGRSLARGFINSYNTGLHETIERFLRKYCVNDFFITEVSVRDDGSEKFQSFALNLESAILLYKKSLDAIPDSYYTITIPPEIKVNTRKVTVVTGYSFTGTRIYDLLNSFQALKGDSDYVPTEYLDVSDSKPINPDIYVEGNIYMPLNNEGKLSGFHFRHAEVKLPAFSSQRSS